MSMLINQGKHTITEFKPIIEDGVIAEIEEIELLTFEEGQVKIKFLLLSGQHKPKCVYDKINYLPNTILTWKYYALREAIGCPYSRDEDSMIDLQELFLYKKLYLNLSSYSYYDRLEHKHLGQKISYSKKLVTMDDLMETKEEDDDPSCNVFDFDDIIDSSEI